MRNKLKMFLLPLVLTVYAFLYIATSGWNRQPVCEDDRCRQLMTVSNMVREGRPYVRWAGGCLDSAFCIGVDSVARDWSTLADTACNYLNNVNLNNYRVFVMNLRSDTLVRKRCP